jgi:hypothetical protein
MEAKDAPSEHSERRIMDYALWVVNPLYSFFPSIPSNNQLDGFWSMDDNSLVVDRLSLSIPPLGGPLSI